MFTIYLWSCIWGIGLLQHELHCCRLLPCTLPWDQHGLVFGMLACFTIICVVTGGCSMLFHDVHAGDIGWTLLFCACASFSAGMFLAQVWPSESTEVLSLSFCSRSTSSLVFVVLSFFITVCVGCFSMLFPSFHVL